MGISTIDVEVYWNRLINIVDEAGAALQRTSFSPIVRESNDFACVLLDDHGRLLAQSTLSVPGFLGTAALSLQHMLESFPRQSLSPGDVLFTNDPWIGTGHLPDSTLAAPIFVAGRIVAFAVVIAHLSDVGGRQWSADSTEVFEEGIRFPIMKLVESGRENQLIFDMLAANVRLPGQVLGDLRAQLSAIHVTDERLRQFLSEYHLPDLREIAAEIFAITERMTLEGIRKIPPGVYTGRVSADGWEHEINIRATVTITGDEIAVDYTGSSPQSRFGINESYNHTYAYTVYPFKCMLAPGLQNNDGFLRRLRVRAPSGSIVNCRPPAAVGARQLVGHLLQAAIFEAMAEVLPDQVQADSGTPLWTIVLRGVDVERDASFSTILFFNGGIGAMRDRHGRTCSSFPANISNTPIEITENLAPVLFTTKRIAEGSGGAGRTRGGEGQIVAFQSRWPTLMRVSLLTERNRVPAKGLFGGQPGAVGHVRQNGKPVAHTKGILELMPGDTLELALPGGGGFGQPLGG
jgi:N-methylhydantoinase B